MRSLVYKVITFDKLVLDTNSKCVVLLVCIQKVPCSHLGSEIGCRDWGFSRSFCPFKYLLGHCFKLGHKSFILFHFCLDSSRDKTVPSHCDLKWVCFTMWVKRTGRMVTETGKQSVSIVFTTVNFYTKIPACTSLGLNLTLCSAMPIIHPVVQYSIALSYWKGYSVEKWK